VNNQSGENDSGVNSRKVVFVVLYQTTNNDQHKFNVIAMDPTEERRECKGVDCIKLVQDMVQWRVFVNTLMVFRVPQEHRIPWSAD
jgi:hypothetical protein